jgi:hypothetical protein
LRLRELQIPAQLDAACRELALVRDQCQFPDQRLGDQLVIDGVAMIQGQRAHRRGVTFIDRPRHETAVSDQPRQLGGGNGQFSLCAEPLLDGDLPHRRGARECGVSTLDRTARRRRHGGIVEQPPQQRVGIEQQPHRRPSNSRNGGSGKFSKTQP